MLSQLPTLNRLLLDKELILQFRKLSRGVVLDVGAKHSPYLDMIPHKKYVRMDILPDSHPDVVGDIHKMKFAKNTFDTVIATEVLEHLYDPQKAVNEIWRVLKPGGKAILSTRFLYPYHPDPKDYYRYTKDSLAYLFRKFRLTEVKAQGNRVQVIWQMLESSGFSLVMKPFNPLVAKISFPDRFFSLGFVIIARK